MTIRVANAPVSWGIFEFEEVEQQFTYTEVLDQIAGTDYEGLEYGPWGFLPSDTDELRPALESRNLQLLSAFVPVKLVDPNAHEDSEAFALKVGKVLAEMGALYIVLSDDNGAVPELVAQAGRRTGVALSPDEWDVVAKGVNRIARSVYDQLGLKTVFHHHCAGYVETPAETRELLKRADPDLVGLCLDMGHWHYAGGDAVECVKEFGERVRYLHFKDCSHEIAEYCRIKELNYFQATEAGVFCLLGEGEVDFRGVVAEMEKLGYDGWGIVEQDIFADDHSAPERYARFNREYLRSIGL